MSINKSHFRNAPFFYHLINLFTYWVYLFLNLFSNSSKVNNKKVSPLIITGMFRSGTTITASLLQLLGLYTGPKNHLLGAKGPRKSLNPEGFIENYPFMDLSMYVFYLTNSYGDNPPEKSELEKLNLSGIHNSDAVKFSLLRIHDSRISNVNKINALLKFSFKQPQTYLNYWYNDKSFIKNPHFAPLYFFFKKIFPDSTFLVVFKNPVNALKSAKKVSLNSDYTLYCRYYDPLIAQHQVNGANIFFFSFEEMVKQPEVSLRKLAELVSIDDYDEKKIVSTIKKPVELLEELDHIPESVLKAYNYMLSHSINSKV